jgi:hypothetical protein
MPLHVQIRLNRQLLTEIHIARVKGGTSPSNVNTYIATTGEEPLWLEGYQEHGVEFKHRYGDGAEVCVSKALKALDNSYKEKFDD